MHFSTHKPDPSFEFLPEDGPFGSDSGPAAQMIREFMAELGDREINSLEELQNKLEAFEDRGNARPIDDFEGLSPEQMHTVLYAPLNSEGTIHIAEHVQAGPDVAVLMMLDELRQAIGSGTGVSRTRKRELPPKLVRRLYNIVRRTPVFAGLLGPTRVRDEKDVPVVHVTRNILEVSGHLRTYGGKFIMSRSFRRQFKKSGYSTIYPELFRSYVQEFNWSFWPSYLDIDPFQQFFSFTLFQLAKRGHEFVRPSEYAARFYDAFPMILQDLIWDDDSSEALEYSISIYVIQVVIHFWGFFGLIDYADLDPASDDFLKIRATPLFYELVRFPEDWLA